MGDSAPIFQAPFCRNRFQQEATPFRRHRQTRVPITKQLHASTFRRDNTKSASVSLELLRRSFSPLGEDEQRRRESETLEFEALPSISFRMWHMDCCSEVARSSNRPTQSMPCISETILNNWERSRRLQDVGLNRACGLMQILNGDLRKNVLRRRTTKKNSRCS